MNVARPMSAPPSTGVTVLYIGGFGRSGSTLLERVLGQVPGMVAVGEIVHLIERGLIGDERCGCGAAFHACPFWADVGVKAFGGWDRLDGADWLALKRRVDRNRYIPLLLAPVVPRYRHDLDAHVTRLACLYTAIAEVSGARVVVDASKHASTAFALRRLPGVGLRVLHLVRDSRGVAYSWTKEVSRPEIAGQRALMPQYSPFGAAVRWLMYNSLFHVLALTGTPVTRLRYESFVARPVADVTRQAAAMGLPLDPAALTFLADDHVDLAADHSVAGNPMRFRTGRLELRRDEAWRTRLASRHRRMVTAVTAPLLARYGYLARREDG